MKSIFISFSILCFTIFLNAQIPNSGFENWDDEYTPQDWTTNNFVANWVTVSRTSNSFDGMYAARLEIPDVNGFPIFPVLAAKFVVSQYADALNSYYQFYPVDNEVILSVYTFYFKDGLLAGSGSIDIENAASSYTLFSFDPSGGLGGPADSIWIQFEIISSSTTNYGIGSYALIDQINFGPTSDVKQIDQNPADYSLKQNYPNPFNPSTVIEFSIPQESFVELKVFDILGNEVATLANDDYAAGNYKADFTGDNLPSGIYVARLTAGNFIQTKKMLLLK